jgi:molybdopterin-guanine dinucleotide biosynthesis protein A
MRKTCELFPLGFGDCRDNVPLRRQRGITKRMDSCEGFILAGGLSSRMGKDKSRLELGGRTFVERVAEALAAVTSKVSIVGANPQSDTETFKLPAHVLGDVCSLPLVSDVFEKWGALGGLHGALAASRAEWTAVVACDLPFVTADLFRRLASKAILLMRS